MGRSRPVSAAPYVKLNAAPDRNDYTRSQCMRLAFLIVLLFVFLAWDIAENNGHYTHTISSEIGDLSHQLGL